ncbi:BMP family ABC transporter substrate-binding protein [Maridesulfovibrio sp.]|uniref:BMP family lipoprotein n=1 Tax=Maridesulfovibrio sp. TaxID=2795000 RepID=UPI002A18BB4F|nr:BMP family ABC transporter substrate-binding protein [Maridesulfovibrio sp.]
MKIGFVASGDTINDNSFNEMVAAGLRRLQKERHVELVVRRGGFTVDSVTEAVESAISEGAEIVVVNSMPVGNRFGEIVLDHPEVVFIFNDSTIDGYSNVVSINYAHGSGSCLVGALCAWQTKTGKIGFIGGNELPVITEFLKGFQRGVELSGKEVEVDVKFVRRGSSEKGFEDPQQANALALKMYGSGTDIIYAVAGLSGNGIIQAARETGNLVVGVDSDQDHLAKGTVLTSMMKRLDVAVYKECLAVLNGNFTPGRKAYGLADGAVGLTEMKYSKNLISHDVLRLLENLRKDLVSGKIKVEPSAQ